MMLEHFTIIYLDLFVKIFSLQFFSKHPLISIFYFLFISSSSVSQCQSYILFFYCNTTGEIRSSLLFVNGNARPIIRTER